jgi:hypothetical protein
MCQALPGPEYYGGSAPSRPGQLAASPARRARAGRAAPGRTRTVPVFTAIRSSEEEPSYVPAASPRLPRSTSPWPPGSHSPNHPGVPRPVMKGAGARRSRPISARFGAGKSLRDVTTLVPRVLLSVTLAGPTPSGSANASRLCRGRSRPPRRSPDQAAPSYAALLRQGRRRRSLTSARISSASRRTWIAIRWWNEHYADLQVMPILVKELLAWTRKVGAEIGIIAVSRRRPIASAGSVRSEQRL